MGMALMYSPAVIASLQYHPLVFSSSSPLLFRLELFCPVNAWVKFSRPYEIFNRFYANFHIGKRKVFFNRRLAAALHMGKFLYSGILCIIGIIILFIFCSAMQAKADCQPFPVTIYFKLINFPIGV